MRFTINELLASLICSEHALGRSRSEIATAVSRRRGYALHVAERLVDSVLLNNADGNILPHNLKGEESGPLPLFDEPGIYQFEGREITLALRILLPDAYFFENLVSTEECAQMIKYGETYSIPATMVEDGKEVTNSYRTSDTAQVLFEFLPAAEAVAKRLSRLLRWPMTTLEVVEIQKYSKGSVFKAHTDWIAVVDRTPDFSPTAGPGGRIATLIVYLNQPTRGGCTFFENVGLQVFPKQGAGLYFSYPTQDDASMSVHAGQPPIEGEKWIATFWWWEDDSQWDADDIRRKRFAREKV